MEKQKPRLNVRGVRRELQAEDRVLKEEISYIKKHLDKIWEHVSQTNERLQNLEIQVNLLSRLVVNLAIEKMNMRTFTLMKMIRKIEKQFITEGQIQDLEKLYQLGQTRVQKPKNGPSGEAAAS